MKAIWIDRNLLRLRFKSLAAWHLFWSQGQMTPLALRCRVVAEMTTGAAEVIEALVGVFGALLRPGRSAR